MFSYPKFKKYFSYNTLWTYIFMTWSYRSLVLQF